MERFLRIGSHHPWATIFALLTISLLSVFVLPDLKIEVTAEGMMVKDDPARIAYEDSLKTFGSENVTIIYLRDENLFQRDKLLAIQSAVQKLNRSSLVQRTVSLFTLRHIRTVDGYTYTNAYLKQIPKEAVQLEDIRAAALKNPLVARNLLSEDGKSMAINVFLDTSQYDRHFDQQADELIGSIIEPLKKDISEVFYIGDPYVRTGLTQRIKEDQKVFIPTAVLLLVFTLGITLKQPRAAIIPLITAGLSIVWTLSMMAWLNIPLNIMTSVVPALLIIIGSTEDIHLVTEFFYQRHKQIERIDVLDLVAKNMGLAVLLTFITTYLGFLSISASNLELLQEFGIIASTGLLFNFVITILLVPALLKVVKIESSAATSSYRLVFFEKLADLALRITGDFRLTTIIAISTIILIGLTQATNVHVNNNIMDYFDDDSPVKQQSQKLHENLSGIQTLSLVISGEKNAFLEIENLKQVWKLQAFLKESGHFDSSYSFADFIGIVHSGLNDEWSQFAYLPERSEIVEEYMSLIDNDSARSFITENYDKTRILVRHSITSSEELTLAVNNIHRFFNHSIDSKLKLDVTGENYMNSKAAEYMVKGQFYSLLIILAAIFLIVSLLFMNPKAGLIAVLSNLFPITILFGVMGTLDIPINTSTAMVAAISLGICVDYTMHFMVRYNRLSKSEFRDIQLSLHEAAREEAAPIMSTAIALALGFLSFSLSDFPPVARFGELSALVMLSALVSTYILTMLMLPIPAWLRFGIF